MCKTNRNNTCVKIIVNGADVNCVNTDGSTINTCCTRGKQHVEQMTTEKI